MANWVYIENGQIVEYHDTLPKNWRHVSGLDLSIDNLPFLKNLGWYKVIKDQRSFDIYNEKLVDYSYNLVNDEIIETRNVSIITQEEKDLQHQNNIIGFLRDLREERNRLLAESDWTQLVDVVESHSTEWNQSWKTYRQTLRDLPNNMNDIQVINWPEKPINVT